MKKRIVIWGFAMLAVAGMKAIDDPVQYVNPLVGSHSTGGLSTGNTYPAIALPWGMNFWTPQTGKMGDGWCYTYDAEKIRGFKQTHQPSHGYKLHDRIVRPAKVQVSVTKKETKDNQEASVDA